MTEETKETQESQAPEPEVQESTSSDVDVAEFIAESKKYRQRAQKAETKLEKLQKQMDVDRQKQMADNEEWRELAEERANKIAELEPIVERATAMETAIRDELLSDFSEEDREDFKELPTPALRKVHGKLHKQNPAKTETNVAGISSTPSKKMGDMTDAERRDNWSSIVAGYIK